MMVILGSRLPGLGHLLCLWPVQDRHRALPVLPGRTALRRSHPVKKAHSVPAPRTIFKILFFQELSGTGGLSRGTAPCDKRRQAAAMRKRESEGECGSVKPGGRCEKRSRCNQCRTPSRWDEAMGRQSVLLALRLLEACAGPRAGDLRPIAAGQDEARVVRRLHAGTRSITNRVAGCDFTHNLANF